VNADLVATWIAVLVGCVLSGALGFVVEARAPDD
jgi:hypothetical protein